MDIKNSPPLPPTQRNKQIKYLNKTVSKLIPYTNGGKKVSRNSKCFCGSGKKFKYCHFLKKDSKDEDIFQR